MNERKDKVYYSQGDQVKGLDLFTMDKLLDTFGNEKKNCRKILIWKETRPILL